MKNLLTDIAGVRVGHADDKALASGVTAVIFDTPAVAAIDVRGGGPGTREGALLDLANTVERIDAIALAGGSAFGLEAGGGVQAWLAEQGRGFAVRGAVIPIVPGAICFDLLNGGNKKWGRFAPYRDLGYIAAAAAAANFALGSVGAGLGATTANFKGGLGSASAATRTCRGSRRWRSIIRCTHSGMVADASTVWRADPTAQRLMIRSTSRAKPASSISSASSSTRYSTAEKLTRPCPTRSRIRPGHPTTMSGPPARAWNWAP